MAIVLAGVGLLVGFWQILPQSKAAATGSVCGADYTYEKSSDFDNDKVSFEFEEDESWKSGYKRIISVTGNNGFSVKKVWLDVDSDGYGGYKLYANGPLNNLNPNPGDEINWARQLFTRIPTPRRFQLILLNHRQPIPSHPNPLRNRLLQKCRSPHQPRCQNLARLRNLR